MHMRNARSMMINMASWLQKCYKSLKKGEVLKSANGVEAKSDNG